MIFFFQMSADPPCIYDNTYYTCSSTESFLIFILIKSLHAIKKSEIFPDSLLNIGGLVMSIFDPVLD